MPLWREELSRPVGPAWACPHGFLSLWPQPPLPPGSLLSSPSLPLLSLGPSRGPGSGKCCVSPGVSAAPPCPAPPCRGHEPRVGSLEGSAPLVRGERERGAGSPQPSWPGLPGLHPRSPPASSTSAAPRSLSSGPPALRPPGCLPSSGCFQLRLARPPGRAGIVWLWLARAGTLPVPSSRLQTCEHVERRRGRGWTCE